MKLSSLLEIIGSGSLLLLAGAVTFIIGIGYGFSEFSHLPLWACLCGLGALAGIIGFALIDHGSEEAEKKVSHSLAGEVVHHKPWFIAGASFLGGLLLARMFRPRPKVVLTQLVPGDGSLHESTVAGEPLTEKSSFDVTGFVSDQAKSLGSLAARTTIALAWQRVGAPAVQRLVDHMFGPAEGEPPSPATEAPRPRAGASRAGAAGPSPNGASRVS